MPSPVDLTEVINDAITDVELPLEEPDLDTAASDDLSHVEEPTTTDSEPEAKDDPVVDDTSVEVSSPASKGAEAKPTDDFEKRFGIAQNSSSGRENRIPYSRVTKIVSKAQKEAEDKVRGEYTPKVTEFETKVKDYEAKVTDYEGRLGKVAEFENILVNDAPKFLTMLAGMPQYQAYLRPLFEQQPSETPTAADPTQVVNPDADMPQPDEKLPDGTMVYSMAGLSKLNSWNRVQAATQARKEALDEVNTKYGGMYKEWEAHQRVQAILPKVQAQITEARKWAQFSENEQDIIKALQADANLSLEGAYNKVVVPKLVQATSSAQVDRSALEAELRTKILAEIKNTPPARSTSAASRQVQPNPTSGRSGPKSLESVIEESLKALR